MAISESCVTNDIIKVLKDNFNLVFPSSVERRIRRFFNNSLFNNYDFYHYCIKHIISNYKLKHNDNRVHIIMDHMFSKNAFTVFMITLRVGKQSIPLWFRCFKDKNYNLIFIGDRWFNSTSLMNYIDKLGHTYIFRLKSNYKCFVYYEKENHRVWKNINDLFHYKHKSTIYEDIGFTKRNIKTNIVIGPTKSVQLNKINNEIDEFEPWFIITNGDPKRALKDYSYRFGAIEFLFKAEKSNGFFLEKSSTSNLKAFENMYTYVCFTYLWMSILGIEYSKNKSCY